MYSSKLNRGSSEQVKRGVLFSPGCGRGASVEEGVERGMIRVANLGLIGGVLGGMQERIVVLPYVFVFARR